MYSPLTNHEKLDFAFYFRRLGYQYSWDKNENLYWHELYKDGKLVLQVEMIPLDKIIKDMCELKDTEVDYFVGGPKETDKEYDELCNAVREFENQPLRDNSGKQY